MEVHNALWHLISQTDLVSKIILCSLITLSIFCWAFAIYKIKVLKLKLKELKEAKSILHSVTSLEDFLGRTVRFQNFFVGQVIANYLADFKMILKMYDNKAQPVSTIDWQLLQENMSQSFESVITQEEKLIPFLSTSAQAAPLIGLFGTVWGLIHSFLGIAQQKSADMAAVAPGIAEALITTLAGLVVAIPSLILFNYTMGYMRLFEQELTALTDRCLWIMRNIVVNQESLNKVNQSFIPQPNINQKEVV